MTSKIKVDNIENQCGGAVVTKCGGTTTITGSVVKANNIQASDAGNIISQSGTTITLGASGDTINLASGASQTGFGRTGTVDWDTTPKTTGTFTAVSGEGYFCNTSGGVITANLPAGSAGAIVSFADYAGTWQTYNVTVTPNGTDKIGSLNENANLDIEGQSVTFVYVDSTQGWINTMDSTSNVRGAAPFIDATGGTITTVCTDYRVHTFTGPGTFTVTAAGTPAGSNTVDYLVVAGGGTGGWNHSGGAGAGGYRESSGAASGCYTASPLGACVSALPVLAQGYEIIVGGGGAFQPGPNNPLCNSGSNSSFSTITSTGGGGGGSEGVWTGAGPGGSGGGSSQNTPGNPNSTPGSGNTPPVSPPQGNSGGSASQGGPYAAAGGGGATAAGTPGRAGPGGNGATSSINATPTTRAGGGGGAGVYGGGVGGSGGSGGGGAGQGTGSGTSGTINTGGGGGGSRCAGGGGGGSGIVIIRYKFQ